MANKCYLKEHIFNKSSAKGYSLTILAKVDLPWYSKIDRFPLFIINNLHVQKRHMKFESDFKLLWMALFSCVPIFVD